MGNSAQHSVRVFRQFLWLKAGSVKMALPRPTHQRVSHSGRTPSGTMTLAVGRLVAPQYKLYFVYIQ